MKRLKYLALATLVAFAACDEGVAPPTGGNGSVTVTVTSDEGGVANVQVSLQGPTSGSLVTGANGTVTFNSVQQGAYAVTITPPQGTVCASTSQTTSVTSANLNPTVQFACGVGGGVEASVAIERITDTGGSAVDRSAVEGVIVIQVGIDENDQDVDLLEVFLGDIKVCEQSFEEGAAVEGPLRQGEEFEVDCVVNTAALRDLAGNPPAQIDAESGRPFEPIFLNGQVDVRAQITTESGDTETATQTITLLNEDAIALSVTNDNADDGEDPDGCVVGEDDHPEFAFDDEGFRWLGGDICITAWPVIFSAPFDPNDPFLDRITLSFDPGPEDEVGDYILTDTEPGEQGEFFFVLDEDDPVDEEDLVDDEDNIVVSGTDPVAPAGGLNTSQSGVEDFDLTSVTSFGQSGPGCDEDAGTCSVFVIFQGELQSGTGAINNVLRIDNENPDAGFFFLFPHDVIINDIMPDADGDFWSDGLEVEPFPTSDFDIFDGDEPWFCVDGFEAADDGDAVDLGEDWCDGDVALRLGWVNDDYDFAVGKHLEDDNPPPEGYASGGFPVGVGLIDEGAVMYFVADADEFEDDPTDQDDLRDFVATGPVTSMGTEATGGDIPEALQQTITNDDLIVIAQVMDRLWNSSYIALNTIEVDNDDFDGSDGFPDITDEGDFTIGHDGTIPEISVEDRPADVADVGPPADRGGQVNPNPEDLFHFYIDDEENLEDDDDGFSGPAVNYFELHEVLEAPTEAEYEDVIVGLDDGDADRSAQPRMDWECLDGGADACPWTGFDAITFDSDPADVPELDELGFHTFIVPLTVDDSGEGYFWFRATGWDHAGNMAEFTEDLAFDGNLFIEDPDGDVDTDDDIPAEGDGLWYLNDTEEPAIGVGLGLLVGGFDDGDVAEVDVAAVDNVDLFRIMLGWNVELFGDGYVIVPSGGNIFVSSWGIPIVPEFEEDDVELNFYGEFETLDDGEPGEPGPSGSFYCSDFLDFHVLDQARLWSDGFETITNDACGGSSTVRGPAGPNGVRLESDGVTLLGQTGNFDPEDVFERVCYYAMYDAAELYPVSTFSSDTPDKPFHLLEFECTGVGPANRTTGDGGSTGEGQAFLFPFPDQPDDLPDGGETVAIFFTEDNEVGLTTWIIE